MAWFAAKRPLHHLSARVGLIVPGERRRIDGGFEADDQRRRTFVDRRRWRRGRERLSLVGELKHGRIRPVLRRALVAPLGDGVDAAGVRVGVEATIEEDQQVAEEI